MIGRSLVDRGDFEQAVSVYAVSYAGKPHLRAEAHSDREALQRQAEDRVRAHNSKWGKAGLSATALQNAMGAAIAAYRKTYQNYPRAPLPLMPLMIVRHYVDTKPLPAADLLESVFNEYPDAAFLDEMLMLWAKVAYRCDNAMAQPSSDNSFSTTPLATSR